MTVSESIKKTREDLKDKTPKEKWAYFFDYYKWHVLAVLLAIALLIQGTVTLVTRKDTVLSGNLLNCFTPNEDLAYQEAFFTYAGLNPKKAEVLFQTNMQLTSSMSPTNAENFQLIHASVAAQRLDFITGDASPFQMCAYSKSYLFADLRKHLPAKTLQQLEDRLYYVDGAILYEEVDPFSEEASKQVEYPDPHKPEEMEDPIPVGIAIGGCKDFMGTYYPYNETMYIGVIGNAPHLEHALQFVNFLLSENN